MFRPLLSLAFLFAFQAIVFAQEVGSAAAYNALSDIQKREQDDRRSWSTSRKITHLKPEAIPKTCPSSIYVDTNKVPSGWTGDLSQLEFKVLSVVNAKEMLLVCGDDIVWLVGFPTSEFTTDLEVRIVGPVKAGQTKSYQTVNGSNRTVRTFSLLEGEAVANYEKELERKRIERERKGKEAEIKKVVKSIVWGDKDAVHPRGMEKLVLRKYKEELEQVGRYIKASKITAGLSSPMTFDPKKKRIEFDSEESRTIATDHLKSLSADIPK